MDEQKVILKAVDYNRLVKKLQIYEKKLQDINDIATDLAAFNSTYEKIRKLSEVGK